MLNSVKNNNVAAPIQKQVVHNSTNSGADFLFALNNTTQALTPTSGDIKFAADGSFIIGDGKKLHFEVIKMKEQRPVTTQEIQDELGVSKAEAEKILNEFKLSVSIDYNPKESDVHIKDLVESSRALKEGKIREAESEKLMAEHMSPAGQKKYLMSQKLEAVVRDKEGNIVAKLYKNGMSMNLGYDGGTTPAEKLKKLESDPNVTVTHYSGDFSDFDLIPEEVTLAERDYLKRPELYPPELLHELRALNEQLLALFHGNLKTEPKSFAINDVLTAHDKKLVDAATPKTVTELKEVNGLAAKIAIDRETGSLSGEVDENYINKLIAEQSNDHQETIQFSTLQKSLAFLKQERADFFRRTA